MEDPLQRKTALTPDEVQVILNAGVGKVTAARRKILSDLDAVEDRVRRLGIDARRLLPLSGRAGSHGVVFPRVLAVCKVQRRLLSFEGVAEASGQNILGMLVGSIELILEAADVLTFCERCVGKWGRCPKRNVECFDDIYTALGSFLDSRCAETWGDDDREKGKGREKEQDRAEHAVDIIVGALEVTSSSHGLNSNIASPGS
ncbi:hypothetical protein F5Y10DRAFT_284956 [Nemania abortiva]|nr:hypothetical protein F5Y10DRAFT_284956 [Nemania abortiva]